MKQDSHLLDLGLYLLSALNALALNYEGRQSPLRFWRLSSSLSNALLLNYEGRQSPPLPRPLPLKPLECSVIELQSKAITPSSSAWTVEAPQMLCP